MDLDALTPDRQRSPAAASSEPASRASAGRAGHAPAGPGGDARARARDALDRARGNLEALEELDTDADPDELTIGFLRFNLGEARRWGLRSSDADILAEVDRFEARTSKHLAAPCKVPRAAGRLPAQGDDWSRELHASYAGPGGTATSPPASRQKALLIFEIGRRLGVFYQCARNGCEEARAVISAADAPADGLGMTLLGASVTAVVTMGASLVASSVAAAVTTAAGILRDAVKDSFQDAATSALKAIDLGAAVPASTAFILAQQRAITAAESRAIGGFTELQTRLESLDEATLERLKNGMISSEAPVTSRYRRTVILEWSNYLARVKHGADPENASAVSATSKAGDALRDVEQSSARHHAGVLVVTLRRAARGAGIISHADAMHLEGVSTLTRDAISRMGTVGQVHLNKLVRLGFNSASDLYRPSKFSDVMQLSPDNHVLSHQRQGEGPTDRASDAATIRGIALSTSLAMLR